MVNTLTQQQVETFLKPYGFQGTATGGAADRFLASNPTAKAAFDPYSASGGMLGMNAPVAPTATNPYPDLTGGTGVVPMTVDPLHEWEKKGLTALSGGLNGGGGISMANQLLQEMNRDPQAFAAKYTNPQATGFLTQAGSATSAGMNPITQQEVQGIANPFSDALKNRLNEQGQRARAELLRNQGVRGARSFGDTAQGTRLGMIDQELLSGGADIDYKTYQDALGMMENMRNRSLNAGGQFGNLATTAQGITNSALSAGTGGISNMFNAGIETNNANRQNFKDQLGAGSYIRTYNQGVNDMIGADMLAEAGDPAAKLAQALQLLQGFNSTTSTGKSTDGNGTLSNLGSLATGLSGFLGAL